MKIRTNYVSNSSSSSFCILGIVVDYHEYEDLPISDCDLIDTWTGISVYDEDELIIGASPTSMRDDETLAEFKERVLKQLRKLGFKDTKIKDLNWHIDGGYDR